MNVIEQSIRGKLEEAGYTSISKLPNRRDLAEWKLVKDDCGLANHEMLEVMNAVFPKDAAPAQGKTIIICSVSDFLFNFER